MSIFWFVMLPVGFFEIHLKGGPVMSTISRKKFGEIFDSRCTVIGEAGTFLGVSKAIILTFDVPIFQEVGNVVAVEEHRSELARARHHSMRAYVDKGGGRHSRRVIVRHRCVICQIDWLLRSRVVFRL